MHDETIAIHGGYEADGTRAVAVPIYQTIAHDFIDAEHASAVLDLEIPGFHYNRINNPTNDVLEKRIAALEGGTAALVVASGMAAVSYSILTVALAGSNFVVAPQLYGATFTYFAHVLPTLGIEARFAADDRAESIAALIDDRTCAVFCETIGNPAGNIVDLEAVAAVAHAGGHSPDRRQHRRHPADVEANSVTEPMWSSIHSLSSSVGTERRSVAPLSTAGTSPGPTTPIVFPCLTNPKSHSTTWSLRVISRNEPFIVRARAIQLRNTGATLSPFSAFQLLQGLETMAVRLDRHESNARAVAAYLAADPRVEWVSFAGFPDHPYHHLVQRYLHGRVPSIITFGAAGGYEAGLTFFDSLAALQATPQSRRRQIVGHPSGLDDASPAQSR